MQSEGPRDSYVQLRRMMAEIISAHTSATEALTGVSEIGARILDVMTDIPRHEFVPVELRAYAHADGPLPIGCEKTISQPFITALMTDLLSLEENETVLEIGTGLGYHTAVLSKLANRVYTVEIIEELANQAAARLSGQECTNVEARVGNGYQGWPDHAPFDKIIVAAAPELIPPPLLEQLRPGGRMVIPAGLNESQQLMVVDKDREGRISVREILPVRFGMMEGI